MSQNHQHEQKEQIQSRDKWQLSDKELGTALSGFHLGPLERDVVPSTITQRTGEFHLLEAFHSLKR